MHHFDGTHNSHNKRPRQAELRAEERPDAPSQATLLGKPAFLERALSEQGVGGGLLSMTRDVSTAPDADGDDSDDSDATADDDADADAGAAPPLAAPLARDGAAAAVTDANKAAYLERWLEHKLVRCIAPQAAAFAEGVEDVVPSRAFSLLSADEMRAAWGGAALDDAALAAWRARATMSGEVALQAALLWEWLAAAPPTTRANVLRFATGSSRLEGGAELSMRIDRQLAPVVLRPTAENGLKADARLARAATCSRAIHLPAWADMEELDRGMRATLLYGGGFALV